MKCCILAIGGAGEQAARAFAYGALAGIVEAERVELLMVETDAADTPLSAWCADYAAVRRLWPAGKGPKAFRTELNCRCWPGMLSERMSTLRKLAEEPGDELLLRALFDTEAADADLREGFHGRCDVGAAMLTALLNAENGCPGGALEEMLREAEAAACAGEEVRFVLLGSAMGGLGGAGLTVLARYLRQRMPQAQTAAVVLLPYFRGEETQLAQSRAALKQWAADGLCETIYLLGLEQASYLAEAEGHQQARMPEWLAAACAEDFLRTGKKGVYGWRTALDSFDWDAFGAQARRFRQGYTCLTQAALALRHELGDVIRRGVTEPRWLRDKLIVWYAKHFMTVRKMDEAARNVILAQLEALLRLSEGYLLWLGEIIATLPPQLRTGSDMNDAIRSAQENYDQIVRQHAQLVMLRQSAERSGLVDSMVYRGGMVDPELEQLSQAIDAARERLKLLEEKQQACLARSGGQAHLAMLRQTLVRCQAETAQFRAQTEEAEALIRQAEASAADPGRIATARTKLQRMEHSLELLEAREQRVREDMAQAKAAGVRTIPPEVAQGTVTGCGLFPAAMLNAPDRRSLEAAWPEMQQLKEYLAQAVAAEEPMAGFLAALLNDGREGN